MTERGAWRWWLSSLLSWLTPRHDDIQDAVAGRRAEADRFDYSNVRRNTGAMSRLSVNYLIGRAKIATGNIESDREAVRWVRLRSPHGPTLDWIGDGPAFDPEGLVQSLP